MASTTIQHIGSLMKVSDLALVQIQVHLYLATWQQYIFRKPSNTQVREAREAGGNAARFSRLLTEVTCNCAKLRCTSIQVRKLSDVAQILFYSHLDLLRLYQLSSLRVAELRGHELEILCCKNSGRQELLRQWREAWRGLRG